MTPIESSERGYPNGGVIGGVEPVLSQMEDFEPRFWVVTHEASQFEELFPKLTEKNGVAVRDYGFWCAVKPKNFYHETAS